MFLHWRGYLVGVGLVALATWLKYLAQPTIIPANIPILYLLAIVLTAIFFGLGPSIFVSILSALAFDLFFLPPLFTLSTVSQDVPIIVIFLFIGVIVSLLASNLRHKTEEAKRLNVNLIKTQEEERKRIARDLHDGTSPTLVHLSLELDAMSTRTQNLSEETVQRLKELREKISNIQQDIRQFSHELYPAILDNLGLETALETLVVEFNAKGCWDIQFGVTGRKRSLASEVNLALYRIVQDALNNVCKHAKASKAMVSLEYKSNRTKLSIADNGIGFDLSTQTKGGLGLTAMQQRANLIGANLKVESKIGRGTTISVEVAFQK